MSLAKTLKLKPTRGTQNTRLFFYTDGLQLSAAIIARDGKQLKILASAQSRQITAQTLADLLTELATQVPLLPKHAIMLHSRMALGLLDIPGTDDKALTEDKISNIVRWEMETFFSEQLPPWSIGSLLVQAKVMTSLERDHIIEIQQQDKQRAASVGGKLLRFGELAIAQGALDQATLEQYLGLQNESQESDNALISGWHKSSHETALFCTAMSAQEQYRWIQLFDENQLRIERFYPVIGAISTLIEPEPSQCLLEIHPGSLVFSLLENGVVQSIEIVNALERSLSIADVLNLIRQHDGQINLLYVWGSHPQTTDLFEQLKRQASIPLLFVAWPTEKLVEDPDFQGEDFIFPVLGVAQDYFFQPSKNARLLYVLGMPAPPPFYQQRKWQVGLGVSVVLLALLGIEFYFKQQLNLAQQDIEHLTVNYKTLKKNNKKLISENRRYAQLESKMNALETSYATLQVQKKAVEDNLIERQKFMQAFLPLLIRSIDKDVVLDSLDEVSWYQFRVKGWALNLDAVNQFENSLTRHLDRFNMLISKSPSSLLKNGVLAGAYQFDFQLIRENEKIK